MTENAKRLVRGSIRVFKDACFYEEKDVQQINISYKNMSAVLKVKSISKGLQEIFSAAGINSEPDSRIALRLHNEISGLQVDEIVSDDDDHLRLKFSGLTESTLQHKLSEATKWLKSKKIFYGESDGKVACVFKCLTSDQLEMGEF